jgi:tRNA (guanosine-2'-O-)-methyltransferase
MGRAVAAIFVGALAVAGCGGARARAATTPLRRPGGQMTMQVVIHEACTPAGPERCFNALDDNCNGIIDEGCGVHTGLIQFVIAWDAPAADVDLLVTDPKGELVEVGRPSATGLVKERDCPGPSQECRGRNFENVYLDKEEAKRGRYRVKVRLERLEADEGPIRVTLGARVGPKSYAGEISLLRAEEEAELWFEL